MLLGDADERGPVVTDESALDGQEMGDRESAGMRTRKDALGRAATRARLRDHGRTRPPAHMTRLVPANCPGGDRRRNQRNQDGEGNRTQA